MTINKYARTLLWGANIWYFGEGMLGPLLAVYTERIGGDLLDITWAWAIFLIATGVCYIIFGRLLNGSRNLPQIIVLGYVLNAILTFGYIFVETPQQLFIIQAALGVAEAICSPAWDTLYARNLDEQNDTYAWGLSTGQSQLITGVATLCGGFIVHYMSFATLFILMGIVQLLAALVQGRLLYLKRA